MEILLGDHLYISGIIQSRRGLFHVYGVDNKLKEFSINFGFLIYNHSIVKRKYENGGVE